MKLTERNRQAVLAKIDRLVAEKFYDPKFKGHDWAALVATHREKILDQEESQYFETAVNVMLRELGSAGLGLISPATRSHQRTPSAQRSVMQRRNMAAGGSFKMFTWAVPQRMLELRAEMFWFRSKTGRLFSRKAAIRDGAISPSGRRTLWRTFNSQHRGTRGEAFGKSMRSARPR